MTTEKPTDRLKNIGLKKDVWLQLTTLAKEREITLSEAVSYLLERTKQKDGRPIDDAHDVGDHKPD